jgi:hypothetical protein
MIHPVSLRQHAKFAQSNAVGRKTTTSSILDASKEVEDRPAAPADSTGPGRPLRCTRVALLPVATAVQMLD